MSLDGTLPLAPSQRVLYADSLRPPFGYAFDSAIATTYSLDLETLLAVPVSLALFALPSMEEALTDQIVVLEAIERTARRLAVFAQKGRLQALERQPSLCALLEDVVYEVRAPRGGSFHPKLWLLCFRAVDDRESDPILRLLVLSRNLTADRSWDVALRLDGKPRKRNVAANRPLEELLSSLPQLADRPLSESVQPVVETLANAALRAAWELPDGFEEITFTTTGLRGRGWRPPPSRQLAVVSPFCEAAALEALVQTTEMPALLLSRREELDRVPLCAFNRFQRTCVLQDTVETEDGEATDRSARLYGLHAKIYVLDRGWRTTLVLGSANATNAGLVSGRNVELLASLTGLRSRVGSVESLFGPEGLGPLLLDCDRQPDGAPEPDPAEVEAEARLEAAQKALAAADLRLKCAVPPVEANQVGASWHLTLVAPDQVPLDGINSLRIWPITHRRETARDGLPLTRGTEVPLGTYELGDLCGFIAFELTATAAPRTAAFTLNLPIDGAPEERFEALVRKIICNRDGFLRYLRLLLADLGGLLPWSGPHDGNASIAWRFGPSSDDTPVLENLVRALAREPGRLRAIDRLIERLGDSEGSDELVPDDFRTLWSAFRGLIAEEYEQ